MLSRTKSVGNVPDFLEFL